MDTDNNKNELNTMQTNNSQDIDLSNIKEVSNEETNNQQYNPYAKKLKNIFEKFNEIKHIKLETIFETVKDASIIYQTERKNNEFVINLNKLLILIIIIQMILIISLFPLKEKEPYLVGFSNATQNFVHIEPANEKIKANEALVRSLIGAYVLNRETINRFDDSMRYEVVRMQSSPKVWKTFETIVSQEDSVYSNSQLERVVKIVNIAKIKDGYANVEMQVGLYYLGALKSQKRYRVSLMYQFNELEIDFSNISKNPTGFIVKEYSVTEIATIKELDEENKVNPNAVTSRIKQAEILKQPTQDSNEFLRDEYQFKDKNNDPLGYKDFKKNNDPMEFKPNIKDEDLTPSQKRKEINDEIRKMRENNKANEEMQKSLDLLEKLNKQDLDNQQTKSNQKTKITPFE